MGSGSSRKITDRPIIRTPKGAGGEVGSGTEAADVCVPSFDVLLKGEHKEGSAITLDASKQACTILLNGAVIGELNDSQSMMVRKCKSLGVVYIGKIITDKDAQHYARFHRSSS